MGHEELRFERDSFDLGYGSVMYSCESGNEPSNFRKCGRISLVSERLVISQERLMFHAIIYSVETLKLRLEYKL
jgi:hypothetical protein